MARYKQGFFVPKNPEKYLGDPSKIYYRSSWEQRFFGWCDTHTSVLSWGSETVVIPYIKPTDGKQHRYFMDIIMKYRKRDGSIVTEIIEIKPSSQTKPPRKKRNGKSNLNEQITFAVNVAKWKAATIWAKERGIKFRIMTEKELFR